jgi:hypothetical protein
MLWVPAAAAMLPVVSRCARERFDELRARRAGTSAGLERAIKRTLRSLSAALKTRYQARIALTGYGDVSRSERMMNGQEGMRLRFTPMREIVHVHVRMPHATRWIREGV